MQLNQLINTYSDAMQRKYGEKVFRVGVSIGRECPHRKNGGCIFCNPESFRGSYQAEQKSIEEQLEKGIGIIKKNCGARAFIAYFQDETSTAGELGFLMDKYHRASVYPGIKALALSTRPDYIDENICKMLRELDKDVTIEIGVQTIHDKSLSYLHRGHDQAANKRAIELCNTYGLDTGVHLIMGIPGESREEMLATIEWINGQKGITEVKFHNLVIYRGTKLEEMWRQGEVQQQNIEEYIEDLSEIISYLRSDIVISRLFTSNILHNDLAVVAQQGNKTKWMNKLRLTMQSKGIIQGRRLFKLSNR